jgi:hypothetical protein
MPASAAQINANRANSLKSCGPRTIAGKERSRGNALKHGLTGQGIALPVEDAAEIERRHRCLEAELKPSGEAGRILVGRIALMSVRMDRCVAHETASLTDRIDQAEFAFDAEWPAVEGEDDPIRDQMRVEAAHRALFDSSKEATLARKYEAAAERCFFRSLKELRLIERQAKAGGSVAETGEARQELASFGTAAAMLSTIEAMAAEKPAKAPSTAPKVAQPAPKPQPKAVPNIPVAAEPPSGGSFYVPFAIGRAG